MSDFSVIEGDVTLRKSDGTELGTNTDPVRTDPTGTTTQPVSAASLPLPAGAATEATLAGRAAEHITAGSPHSVRLTDGTAFYKGTTPADTQPVSAASLPLPAGAATETTLAAVNTATGSTADADTALTVIGRLKQLVTLITARLPAALVGGRLDTNNGAWLGSTAPTVGQKAMASSIPVTLSSDQTAGSNYIEDGAGSGRKAYVDGAFRLLVTANATVLPPASVAVEVSAESSLTGTADEVYVIPSGKLLTVTRVAGGSEGNSGKVSKVSLFLDPAGTGSGMTLIRTMYLGTSNYEYGLDYKATGDGTLAIRLRRERLDGAADDVSGFWSGYRDV